MWMGRRNATQLHLQPFVLAQFMTSFTTLGFMTGRLIANVMYQLLTHQFLQSNKILIINILDEKQNQYIVSLFKYTVELFILQCGAITFACCLLPWT